MNEPGHQVALLPESELLNPLQLLQIAVQRGVDTDQLKALMELQREWKADQAREAFMVAMNAFRAEAITIVKTRPVLYDGTLKYRYAALGDILAVAVPRLSEHGLSHRWETKQEGANITVTCIVTHLLGHSERATLSAAPDPSGGKNGIQAIGSAVAYLERYTFTAATGLAAQDDDGVSAEPAPVLITERQVADLEALLTEVGYGAGDKRQRFLRAFKITKLEDIPATAYSQICKQVESKRQ